MINSLIKRTIKSIPAPHFGTKPNLTLYFELGLGVFVEDESGNLVEQTTPEICQASVRQDSNNKEYELPGSIGLTSLVLIGRCISPKILPIALTPDSKCKATLFHYVDSEADPVGSVDGNFTFIPVIQNRYPAFNEHMGTKIKGYFSTVGRV
jgi:hypothetical protein